MAAQPGRLPATPPAPHARCTSASHGPPKSASVGARAASLVSQTSTDTVRGRRRLDIRSHVAGPLGENGAPPAHCEASYVSDDTSLHE